MSDYQVPDELRNAACAAIYEWLIEPGQPRLALSDAALSWEVTERVLAAVLPAHEAMVRAKVAEELTALAEECAPALTGPRGIRRRTLHAAARHVLPTLTLQQVAEAIADGSAIVMGCPALDDGGDL